MTTRTKGPAGPDTVAELMLRLKDLGDIPQERIRLKPLPGTATEEDLLSARGTAGGKLLELVDGVVVEKALGTWEALLGGILARHLWNHVKEHRLGKVLGGDGPLRLRPGLVRVPDVSFISWNQLGGKFPTTPIAALFPDLAVEIPRQGNTPAEIERKLREYFLAGTRLAWIIDPRKETAVVYTAPDQSTRIGKTGTLDGRDVIPGFRLPLRDLFEEADEGPPE